MAVWLLPRSSASLIFIALGPGPEHVLLDEMVEWLAPRLWVPGHKNHSFSVRWRGSATSSPVSGFEIPLDHMSEEQIDDFVREVDPVLQRSGIEPGDPIPADQWSAVTQALLSLRNDVRQRGN